nr:hypothetical protein [Candidatus Njordarchaeota archaeon]
MSQQQPVPNHRPAFLNIRALKEFVSKALPAGSPLREVILAEADKVALNDFLAKLRPWLILLNHEREY